MEEKINYQTIQREFQTQTVMMLQFGASKVLTERDLKFNSREFIVEIVRRDLNNILTKKIEQFIKIDEIEDIGMGQTAFTARIHMPYVANDKIKELESLIRSLENSIDFKTKQINKLNSIIEKPWYKKLFS